MRTRHRFYGQLDADDFTRSAVLHLGPVAVLEAHGHLPDPDVTPGTRVHAWVSNLPAPGRDADDAPMDVVNVTAVAVAGGIDVMLLSATGPVHGPVRIDYTTSREVT